MAEETTPNASNRRARTEEARWNSLEMIERARNAAAGESPTLLQGSEYRRGHVSPPILGLPTFPPKIILIRNSQSKLIPISAAKESGTSTSERMRRNHESLLQKKPKDKDAGAESRPASKPAGSLPAKGGEKTKRG